MAARFFVTPKNTGVISFIGSVCGRMAGSPEAGRYRIVNDIPEQEIFVEETPDENSRLWAAIKRLENRIEQLRLAVPHVQFKDW